MEYFLREYTNGLDVVESLEAYAQKDFTSETPTLSIPTNATDEEKAALKDAYKEEMKQFIARKGMLRTNLVLTLLPLVGTYGNKRSLRLTFMMGILNVSTACQ